MNSRFANIGHDGNTLAISAWPANVNSNGANGGAPWESDGAAETVSYVYIAATPLDSWLGAAWGRNAKHGPAKGPNVGPSWAQTWAYHRPEMDPEWAQTGPRMGPERAQRMLY
jgi:hypothetical protein